MSNNVKKTIDRMAEIVSDVRTDIMRERMSCQMLKGMCLETSDRMPERQPNGIRERLSDGMWRVLNNMPDRENPDQLPERMPDSQTECQKSCQIGCCKECRIHCQTDYQIRCEMKMPEPNVRIYAK